MPCLSLKGNLDSITNRQIPVGRLSVMYIQSLRLSPLEIHCSDWEGLKDKIPNNEPTSDLLLQSYFDRTQGLIQQESQAARKNWCKDH